VSYKYEAIETGLKHVPRNDEYGLFKTASGNAEMKEIILMLLLAPVLCGGTEESGDLSIPKLLSVIKEASQGKEISIDLDSSCTLEVLSSFVDRCEQVEEMDESEKSVLAIRLSECIFDGESTGHMKLPKECHQEMNTRQQIKQCVSHLAQNSVWWTTYFGYLNLVSDICDSYRGPLEQQRVLNTYRLLEVRLEEMVQTLGKMSGGQFMDALRQELDAMVKRVAAEASERMTQAVEEATKEMTRHLQEQNRAVAQVVKQASDSAAESQRHVEQFNEQLKTMHKDSLEQLAKALGGKQHEIQHLIESNLGSSFQLWSKVQHSILQAARFIIWTCTSAAIVGVIKLVKRTNTGSLIDVVCAGTGIIIGQLLYIRIVQ